MILLRVVRKGNRNEVILARWRSRDPEGLCPVEAAATLLHQVLADRAEKGIQGELAAEPLFGPNLNNKTLGAFVKAGAASQGITGCDAYSLRVGGTQHLAAHLREHENLDIAGGWCKGSDMPRHYAGHSIETTRWWAELMVQPVGLLSTGLDQRPATFHF